jgi:hypothetical protein
VATERTKTLRAGIAATTTIALVSALAAVAASEWGCGSTDGTFSIESSLARPSDYCRATHFPGFPDTLGTTLLVGVVYLTPTFVALASLVALTLGRDRAFRIGLLIAALLVLGPIVTIGLSDVGYAGAG